MKRLPLALHVDEETHDPFEDGSVEDGALFVLALRPEGDVAGGTDMMSGSTSELPKAWAVLGRHYLFSGGTFFLGVRTRRGRPLLDPASKTIFDGIAFYTHAEPKRVDRYVVLESDGAGVHRTPFLDRANAQRAERELAKRTRRTLVVHLTWSVFWHTHM